MKGKHILILTGISAMLFLAAGCMGPSTLELTEKNSGQTFEVKTGSYVTVTLDTNPTTGYMWDHASRTDDSILALCRDTILRPETAKGLCGAGGKRFLKYEVIGPGKASIDLKYCRPWEKTTPPIQRFQVMIYSVGKPKSQGDREDEIDTPRRDQFGNDIRRKSIFDK